MNWFSIKSKIEEGLLSRRLKEPRIRLSALERLGLMLTEAFTGFESNPRLVLELDKAEVESRLSKLKDNGKLNGAEKSVLNNVYQVLRGAW